MTKAKLGDWRWFVGYDEQDPEMIDSGTREIALADGKRVYEGKRVYLVEARFTQADERAMERGDLDIVAFAETRNGEWIKP